MTDGMRLQRKYHCSVEVSAAEYCIQELPRNFQVKIFVEKVCCVELACNAAQKGLPLLALG